ncbi:MAG: marine proteobacterial sortase target protein [Rhodobiaceae bacterium]|nr:MAG: marine proteobacterial sortase target protein [Rhodobiaceae bacterium]
MAALSHATEHRFFRIAALLPLALVCLVLSLVGARADISFVKPNDMGHGGLLLKGSEPGKYVEAPALATDVDIQVTGPIARTRVTQRFENPSDAWVEGVYVFPLPDNAAVDTLKMVIGDKVIEGEIKPKEEARAIYERARDAGQRASLVEQERPNLFTNSVANIGPGETIIIQIEYQETVRQSNSTFSLRFPMVVAPRYNPQPVIAHTVEFDNNNGWGVVDPVPDRDRIEPPVQHPDEGPTNPVTLTLSLDAGFEIDRIISHHHDVRIERSERNATLTLKEGDVPADRDFELTWTPVAGAEPTAALFRETWNGEDYLLLMVTPPYGEVIATPPTREVIFVIDNSGSMAGESMPQAKESLLKALARLKPSDTFNVIRFDNTHEVLFDTSVRADRENLSIARRFVRALEADGGTEMLPALQAALQDPLNDTSRLRQVIFLTDGAIGNEQQLFEAIVNNAGRSRLFTVGIGSAPNSYFMTRAAEMGRGTFTHIGSEAQVAERMKELFLKLENPAMTDLALVWPDGVEVEAWPTPLPDLYRGEPIVLSAKIAEGAEGRLRLTGKSGGHVWAIDMQISADAPNRVGVSQLWARRKIASLEAARTMGGNWEAFDKEISQVALTHHLVSRLTSLVAVDKTPARPGGEDLTRTDVPLNLPAGWEFDKVFGEPVSAPNIQRANAGAYRTMLAMAPAPMMDANAQATGGIALPQTASDAPTLIAQGIISLALALSLLLVWMLWQHSGAAGLTIGRRR